MHGKDSVYNKAEQLDEVTVTSKTTTKRMIGAVNGMQISQQEMFRAACCNLGESFTTNPSVDVSYSDAATGARQIKLLGLSGTYVQMLTETMPAFRGSAIPFALSYVPGTWMKSISVSKGAASVKNGYESITGQIDIEYLKPDDEEKLNINLYGDIMQRIEANADRNFHLSDKLSTNILLHYEKRFGCHDGNDDGYQDMPNIEQFNIGNRWKLKDGRYLMHAGWSFINEDRNSKTMLMDKPSLPGISIGTKRYEAYMKHAFITNPEKQANIALLANAAMNQQDATFYYKGFGINEKNINTQLMYETDINDNHAISSGISLNYDYLKQSVGTPDNTVGSASQPGESKIWKNIRDRETTYGIYAQYTYTLGTSITAMAGIRCDYSSIHHAFITPRMHIKYQPCDIVSFRISAGKGYRTVHPYAENSYLLASGRNLYAEEMKQEEAWNYGISAALNIPLADKTLKINAEYYYTDFINQAVTDYASRQDMIYIHNLTGKSYSHVYQIDATYNLIEGMDITMAYRRNNVKCTYGVLPQWSSENERSFVADKPLTSEYKGLFTASYKDQLELWQIDLTLQLNGGGIMPDFKTTYDAYPQLSAQITRRFRHFDLYAGGENLTNYKQKNPILYAHEGPSSSLFEPTFVYGPIEGAMAYAGIRIKL